MKKYTINDRSGLITITTTDYWESIETTFRAAQVSSISRNFGDVIVAFIDGTKKTFDLIYAQEGMRFEAEMRMTVAPYQNSFSERKIIHRDPAVELGTAIGLLAVMAGTAIYDKIKDSKSSKKRR